MKPTNVTASNIKASNDGSCTKGGGVSQDVPETNIQEPETDGETDEIELGIGSIREAGINFVSEMRASSSITAFACEKAVQGINDVAESVVAYLKQEVFCLR